MDKMKPTSTDRWNEHWMKHVYLTAEKSKDTRTKIGAVLVRHNDIVTEGYNGLPMGLNDDIPERNERPGKYDWFVHAEHNSILQCARRGVSSSGADLFTNGIPCAACCLSIIQARIYKIVIHKQWPNLIHSEKWVKSIALSKEMLGEANIQIEVFDKELGLKGFLDGKEISV